MNTLLQPSNISPGRQISNCATGTTISVISAVIPVEDDVTTFPVAREPPVIPATTNRPRTSVGVATVPVVPPVTAVPTSNASAAGPEIAVSERVVRDVTRMDAVMSPCVTVSPSLNPTVDVTTSSCSMSEMEALTGPIVSVSPARSVPYVLVNSIASMGEPNVIGVSPCTNAFASGPMLNWSTTFSSQFCMLRKSSFTAVGMLEFK